MNVHLVVDRDAAQAVPLRARHAAVVGIVPELEGAVRIADDRLRRIGGIRVSTFDGPAE